MLHFPHAIFIAAFAMGLNGPATAGPIEDGQAAYNLRDFATALRLWRPVAEEGDARAQNNLGVLYENGQGVPQNVNEAVKWYRLAAQQGYAGAQNNLALIYAIGRGGMPRDPLRAHMWFSLAASSLSGELGATVTQSRDVFAGAMTGDQIAEATEMARKCLASNYKDCGPADGVAVLDASLKPSLSTPAVATTSHEVRVSDYPAVSIRLRESGEVTVTYVINQTGSVSTCSVVLTSGSERLDEAACGIVKRRWKYKPATEDGKPVPVQYISKIAFPPVRVVPAR